MTEKSRTITLTERQSTMLMAICSMIKTGDIYVGGRDDDAAVGAQIELIDIGEECALQMGGQTYNEE